MIEKSNGGYVMPVSPVFYDSMHSLLNRTSSHYASLFESALEKKLEALAAERSQEEKDEKERDNDEEQKQQGDSVNEQQQQKQQT